MDLGLKGKKALVTASTGGIGFAIAKALAAEGAHVYVNGRSEQSVKASIEKLKAPSAVGAPYDLSTKEGVEKMIAALPEVDILINNLGIYEPKDFVDITDEDWFHIFDVNVMSGVRLSRHYLPLMLKKNEGRIIFISSESGVNIPTEMIHYGMTKTAQLAIARGLAELTKGTNVTVNSILPGPTYSEGVEKFVVDLAAAQKTTVKKVSDDFFKSTRPSSLLQRFATVDEVAALVAFACSDQAAAINGAPLRVDGGVIRSAH
jgi:NAD(P)-dependent dehydrogenase (short-subunit alcohol dehydrogenase family)